MQQDFITAVPQQRLFLTASHQVIASTSINSEVMIEFLAPLTAACSITWSTSVIKRAESHPRTWQFAGRDWSSYFGRERHLSLKELLNGVRACPGRGEGEDVKRAEEASGWWWEYFDSGNVGSWADKIQQRGAIVQTDSVLQDVERCPLDRHEHWRGWKKRPMKSTLVSVELLNLEILQFHYTQVYSPKMYPKGIIKLLTIYGGWADLALHMLTKKCCLGARGPKSEEHLHSPGANLVVHSYCPSPVLLGTFKQNWHSTTGCMAGKIPLSGTIEYIITAKTFVRLSPLRKK